MRKIEYKIILFLLIIILLFVNYNSFDSFLIKNFSNEEIIKIERVIDGDTVVVNGTSFRLLGINTPEKGEYLYMDAKKFLEEKISNKTIVAEKNGKDRYERELVYLYNQKENINLESVREGYANLYFPSGKDRYYEKFVEAWGECLSKNKNLCEMSKEKCSRCIELYEWDFKNQKVVLYNKCTFDCYLDKWVIKDEGRKKFTFNNFTLNQGNYVNIIVENKTNIKNNLYWKGETYVWTSSGDTLFLRDDKGKLVLWKSEGY